MSALAHVRRYRYRYILAIVISSYLSVDVAWRGVRDDEMRSRDVQVVVAMVTSYWLHQQQQQQVTTACNCNCLPRAQCERRVLVSRSTHDIIGLRGRGAQTSKL